MNAGAPIDPDGARTLVLDELFDLSLYEKLHSFAQGDLRTVLELALLRGDTVRARGARDPRGRVRARRRRDRGRVDGAIAAAAAISYAIGNLAKAFWGLAP
jgi:hypothetical protein